MAKSILCCTYIVQATTDEFSIPLSSFCICLQNISLTLKLMPTTSWLNHFVVRELRKQAKQQASGTSGDVQQVSPAAPRSSKVTPQRPFTINIDLFQLNECSSIPIQKPEAQLQKPPQPTHVQEQLQVKRGQKVQQCFHVLSYWSFTECSPLLQAKQKKMQEKYADQDEEERRLRMEILAVGICVKVAVHNSTWLLFVNNIGA